METENPIGELYDFLYRDSNRLTSYYSQIFQGKLSSFEELEADTDTRERDVKGDLKIASASAKTTETKQSSAKRMYDPHDLNTSDVLDFLQKNEYIHTDYLDAPNGAIILVKGKLFFTDTTLLSFAAKAAELMSQQPNPMQETTPEQALGIALIPQLVSNGFFQPVCFLQSEDGRTVTGTVKNAGMEEPISTYYLKYGSQGLNDVYIIGLKEKPVHIDNEGITEMVRVSEEITNTISNFLCGEDSIRITPLVIFRKFEPIKKKKIILGSASRKNTDNAAR